MIPKNNPKKKKRGVASPRVEALAAEVQNHIQTWIQNAPLFREKLRSLTPDEQESFFLLLLGIGDDQIYALLQKLQGQEEKIDLALIKSLGDSGSSRAADLLHLMAASPSKAVVKSIRKSIFRLKSKGLPVEEMADPSPAIYHPPPPATSEGFISSIIAEGKRIVWLGRPRISQGMLSFSAVLSDLEGILDFIALEGSRKAFFEQLATFKEKYSWEVVEAAPEYCLGLMVEASEINPKKGRALPATYLEVQPLMGTPPPLPLRPLIYQYLEEGEAKSRTDLLDRSASLFQISPFQTWFLSAEEVQKYLPWLKESSASRLILTPYQKESRFMEIYRQVVHELFDEPRRFLYRRRLEEMAYVLWKKGQENDARISLAAALGLEKESGILSPHPFLLELVKRSLTLLWEGEREKKEEELSLIIRP